MIPIPSANPVFGPAMAALAGQSPPGATANSSLSTDDRQKLRPVTALSEPDPAETEPRILGPQIGPLADRRDTTRGERQDRDQDASQDQFQLSAAAVERLVEADPALERLIRREMAQEAGGAEDAPVDQAAFRAKVIDYLKSVYADDPAFQRALKNGTIVVRQTGDDGDPDLQPQRIYTVYRSSAMEGAAEESQAGKGTDGGVPAGVGKNDFIAWWPQ